MKSKLKILLLTSTLLGACDLSPEYKIPKMEIAGKFKYAEEVEPLTEEQKTSWKQAEPKSNVSRGEWWQVFNDKKLNEIQKSFLSDNLDLKIMDARVKQARTSLDVINSEFFPNLSANAGGVRQKLNSQTFGFAAPPIKPFSVYSAGLGLDYEIDLFGKVFTKRKSAQANIQSVELEKESVKLALQADVAQYYFTLRSLDEELKLLNENVKLRKEKLEIQKQKLNLGSISQIDIAQDVVDLNNEISRAEQIKQARNEAESALAIMIAKNPSEFNFVAEKFAPNLAEIPAGLPSELLERRPDVAAAERNLYAANENIGFARAAFFPSISLTANGGAESTGLSNLLQWSNRVWNVGPVLNFPIFEGGKTLANLEKNKAAYEEATANYKKQVLVAFKDVEDSLSLVSTTSKQLQAQTQSEIAALKARQLIQKAYDLGGVNKLELIDTITAYNNIRIIETQTKRAAVNSRIQLVRALGGSFVNSF